MRVGVRFLPWQSCHAAEQLGRDLVANLLNSTHWRMKLLLVAIIFGILVMSGQGLLGECRPLCILRGPGDAQSWL